MENILNYILGITALAFLISLLWRVFSNRKNLPCPSWLSWMVELDNPFSRVSRADFIVEHLQIQPGMNVLDAGCGPGRVTLPLARAVGPRGEVTALDIQPGMLEQVRAKAEAAGISNIHTLPAGLGRGSLPGEAFDRAVLVSVLGEIPDQDAALNELYASLKPGGVLSVTEVIFDPHFQPRSKIQALGRAAGFREKAFLGKRLVYTMHLEKPGNLNP
jgi:SAM-dependent methyltransferase